MLKPNFDGPRASPSKLPLPSGFYWKSLSKKLLCLNEPRALPSDLSFFLVSYPYLKDLGLRPRFYPALRDIAFSLNVLGLCP